VERVGRDRTVREEQEMLRGASPSGELKVASAGAKIGTSKRRAWGQGVTQMRRNKKKKCQRKTTFEG